MHRHRLLLSTLLLVALSAPAAASSDRGPAAPERHTEPVVLNGSSFPTWAAPADVPLKANSVDGARCQGGEPSACTHNKYEQPDASTQALAQQSGVPVERVLGYRWHPRAKRFVQIPFQVDEMAVRYISNNNSGFSFYSETDQHTTYVFDREGFRWTASAADNPCLAHPASEIAEDPVPGLDTDDELVFMAADAGPKAPPGAELPKRVADSYEVAVTDPRTAAVLGYVYVMRAQEQGPRADYDHTNGYVRYRRDADADVFLYSQSSYSGYGAAPKGPYFDPTSGTCVVEPAQWKQRRPGDQATVTTPRYRFRYEGRWLMTELRVSGDEDGNWSYGPDLVDQWKARAFQQRPGGKTPCCGYEEEVNNWGGSSILMGERWGPVRVIRETWGADSGTNVVRRETFYRDEIRFANFLRVHPIPPLDGIYVQWDYNATAVDTYYNPYVPDGVALDGRNDEVFGNSRVHAGPDGVSYDGNDTASDEIRKANGGEPVSVGSPNEPACAAPSPIPPELSEECVYNDVDTADPTFSGPNGLLQWEQVTGSYGTLVTRWWAKQHTVGGAAHAPATIPYYRDDACFDDGTGSDPGPHVNKRKPDEGEFGFWTFEFPDGTTELRARECWDAQRHADDDDYASYLGTRRFYQGSVGTHGLHLLFIVDSDNAHTTVPVSEIDSEQRMVVLPPTDQNVGERYGRAAEQPLVPVVSRR